MNRHGNILKWGQNNKNGSKGSNRLWMHPPEALQVGHVAYLVKFLGNTDVEQPKGIEVVKEGIRKLKFSQQLKRSEGGKTPKVELTISVDGVAIQEPKNKRIFHQYPLHRISYCADDKSDKKFFSFIAKEADSDKHSCFVFVSDKLAEEITLTIGQAFDLAYRRFLESSGRDLEMKKQMIILQKKVQELEKENAELRKRLSDNTKRKSKDNVDSLNKQNSSTSFTFVNGTTTPVDKSVHHSPPSVQPPPLPARIFDQRQAHAPISPSQELFENITLPQVPQATVGRKLENLLLNDLDDFNPRRETPAPTTNGVVKQNGHATSETTDLFGAIPFGPKNNNSVNNNCDQRSQGSSDPFGMDDFSSSQDYEMAIGDIDKKLTEMRDGFSRGLSFGNDDFCLEALDPLANKPN